MPRYSSDKKETTVKLRINELMRTHIETQAKQKSVTMSQYIRELIKSDMQNK